MTTPALVAGALLASLLSGCAVSQPTRTGSSAQPPRRAPSALHTRTLLDSAQMLQARGKYAASQVYLEAALSEISLASPTDSALRPLAEEILGTMRNNLPYSLATTSTDRDYDGQSLLDSLDQTDLTSGVDFGSDTSLVRKYREEAMLDSTAVFDLPVEINDRVLSQLRMFKERAPSHFQRWLERKGRWEQEFTAKLAARGMPTDLIYLAMIESGFSSRATSPAAAAGIWQFIPSTGRRYGLRVDRFVDERRDPWKATDAALDFLSSLYLRYGDWRLAMAAYNCGEGCIDRAIRRLGRPDYWNLPIPAETRNYVPRIFAAAILGKRPEVHGFQYTPWQPLACDTFTVEGGIPLLKIAEVVGAPAESLAMMNPALIKGMTPPASEPYLLRLPPGTRPVFDSAYAFLEKSYQAPQPTRLAHRVRRGETLQRIAVKYGVTVASLKSWNRIRGKKVKTGRTLTIYADDIRTANIPIWQEPPLERRAHITARAGTTSRTPYHRVRRGETLQRVAAKYDVSVADLRSWNDIASSGRLKAGRSLQVGPSVVDPTLSDIPRTQASAEATVEDAGENSSPREDVESPAPTTKVRHRVRRGETLQRIARRYDVTVRDLMAWNDLPSARVKAGTNLEVRTKGEATSASVREESRERVQPERSVSARSGATHRVRRGETLSTIALKNGTTTRELMAANGLRGSQVRVGQKLRVPGSSTSEPREDIEAEHAERPPRVSFQKQKPSAIDHTLRTTVYTVRPGDTLYSIARARSTTVDTLKLLNGLRKADLRVGQVIKVPGEG